MPKIPNDTLKPNNTPLRGPQDVSQDTKGPPKTHLTHHLDLRLGDVLQWTELVYGFVRGSTQPVGRRTIIATLNKLPNWEDNNPGISFKPVHAVIDHGNGRIEDVEKYIENGFSMRRKFKNFARLNLIFKLEV